MYTLDALMLRHLSESTEMWLFSNLKGTADSILIGSL